MSKTYRLPVGTAIAAAVSLILSGAAHAQAPAATEEAGKLDEVIVTGTKRAESSQDVPIAISAISAAELSRTQINDVRALGAVAPGLVLSAPAGFNATGGGMRGTGTNIILVTQDAPVSFLVDEFALSHVTSQFVSLFDLQQVEVYRGPQGTLFGKNTTGGVISLTSKKPVLGEYSADAQVGVGQYENGASFNSVKVSLNLPLGETLALRIAAISDKDDGFYTDDKKTATFPGNVPLWGLSGIPAGSRPPSEVDTTVTGTGDSLGGKDVLAAKAKLLWQPNDTYSAYGIVELVRDRSDSPPGVNESTSSDLLTLLGFPGIQLAGQKDVFSTLISHNEDIGMDKGHRVDTTGVYLTQTLDVGVGEVKSITGYREEQQRLPSTYTGEAFQTLFDSTRNTERYTFQQELRFASKLDGPFNFVAGGNYYKDAFNFRAFFSVGLVSLLPSVNPTTGTLLRPDGRVNLDTRSLFDYQLQYTEQDRTENAVFWDGTYKVNDQWSFSAGLRYSKDKKSFIRAVDGGGLCNQYSEAQDKITVNGVCRDVRSQNISRGGLTPRQWNGRDIPMPATSFGTYLDTDNDWSKSTYRLVVDYKPADGQMWYLSYATGFLSGGFAETCATVSRCAYDPETNKNLELGYKADFLDNTLRVNLAAYITKYDNLQRAVVAAYRSADGSSQQETVTVNTGSSKAKGFDAEVTWIASDQLRVGASLNWLDHEYTSGVLPDLRGTNAPVSLLPYTVPFSPKMKLAVNAGYDIPMSNGSRIALAGDVNYQGESETDVFNGQNTQMQKRTLVNLSATWHEAEGRYSIGLYGANLTNEIYRMAALPVAGLWNFTNYGAPRSYGVNFNVKFGE